MWITQSVTYGAFKFEHAQQRYGHLKKWPKLWQVAKVMALSDFRTLTLAHFYSGYNLAPAGQICFFLSQPGS